jgi:sialidase-1
MFLGPGGAIQTRLGRLIVPAAAKFDAYTIQASLPGFYGNLNVLRAYALYSDDHGVTWQRGTQVGAFTNENQMVELSGNRVMMDARQGNGDHRWVFVSGDGGKTWSAPRPGERVSAIATSIERFTSREAGEDRDRILWTGITGPARRNLVVRVSYDEGQTFTNEKLIYGGWAAYSDAAVLPDKTVAVLWERGEKDGYEAVTLTRFNREFLEPAGTAIPSRR